MRPVVRGCSSSSSSSSKKSRRVPVVVTCITGEDDDGVVGHPEPRDLLQHFPDGGVQRERRISRNLCPQVRGQGDQGCQLSQRLNADPPQKGKTPKKSVKYPKVAIFFPGRVLRWVSNLGRVILAFLVLATPNCIHPANIACMDLVTCCSQSVWCHSALVILLDTLNVASNQWSQLHCHYL